MSRSSRTPARSLLQQTKLTRLPSMPMSSDDDDDDDDSVNVGFKPSYKNARKHAKTIADEEDEEDEEDDFQTARNLRRGDRTQPVRPNKAVPPKPKQTSSSPKKVSSMSMTATETGKTKQELEIEEIDRQLALSDSQKMSAARAADHRDDRASFQSFASDVVDDRGLETSLLSLTTDNAAVGSGSNSNRGVINVSGGKIDWPTRFKTHFRSSESKNKSYKNVITTKGNIDDDTQQQREQQQSSQEIFENDTLDEVRDLIFLCMQSASTEHPDTAVQRVLESQCFHRLRMSRGGVASENRPSSKITPPRLPQVGTNNFINAVVFLDYQRLVIGSGDGSIQIYNVIQNTCSLIMTGHNGSVNDVKLLVDGSICSCSHDHTIKVWGANDGRCIRTLEGHTNWVLCLAVTEKHKIVSGSYDNSIRVWVMKGECLNILYGHAEAIYSLCVLSTGVLVSGSVDTTIKLWDLETGEIIETLEEHRESVMSLCAMSEKDQFASGSLDNSIRIWSVAPSSTLYVCTKILQGHEGSVRDLLELPESNRLVSASDDDSIRVWDYNSEVCQKKLSVHKNRVRSLTRDPDSAVSIVSGGGDRTVCFTNIDKFDDWT